MKRFFISLLTLAVLITLGAVVSVPVLAFEGNGTEESPYVVYNSQDFKDAFSQTTQDVLHIKLGSDINLNDSNLISITNPVILDFNEHTLELENNTYIIISSDTTFMNGSMISNNLDTPISITDGNVLLHDFDITTTSNNSHTLSVNGGSAILTNVTLSALDGIIEQTGGTVSLDGKDITGLDQRTSYSSSDTGSEQYQTSVSHTINDPEYTVTIPSSAELDKPFEIKVEGSYLKNDTQLEVSITDAQPTSTEEGTFQLKSEDGNVISYSIKSGDTNAVQDTTVSLNTPILAVLVSSDGTATANKYINLELIDNEYVAGTYTGTLTFTFKVVPAT